jgi:hypothetical protein
MSFAFSLFFNSKYIEPALVTAYELMNFLDEKQTLYLLFLESNNDYDQEAMRLIVGFKNRFDKLGRIRLVKVPNKLQTFRAYHFDNSIIYKGIIPEFIKNERFILNIDAGILPGGRFQIFLQEIKDLCISKSGNSWVLGAHCGSPSSSGALPQNLLNLPHCDLYPSGAVLLFNCEEYNKREWTQRYLRNYNTHIQSLQYAEQDLMCITSVNGELITIPRLDQRLLIFLTTDTVMGKNELIESKNLENAIFYKHCGSFKPWKYNVIDPNKSVFTKKRARIEKDFPLTGNKLIELNRIDFRPDWSLAFLRAYDYYSSNL